MNKKFRRPNRFMPHFVFSLAVLCTSSCNNGDKATPAEVSAEVSRLKKLDGPKAKDEASLRLTIDELSKSLEQLNAINTKLNESLSPEMQIWVGPLPHSSSAKLGLDASESESVSQKSSADELARELAKVQENFTVALNNFKALSNRVAFQVPDLNLTLIENTVASMKPGDLESSLRLANTLKTNLNRVIPAVKLLDVHVNNTVRPKTDSTQAKSQGSGASGGAGSDGAQVAMDGEPVGLLGGSGRLSGKKSSPEKLDERAPVSTELQEERGTMGPEVARQHESKGKVEDRNKEEGNKELARNDKSEEQGEEKHARDNSLHNNHLSQQPQEHHRANQQQQTQALSQDQRQAHHEENRQGHQQAEKSEQRAVAPYEGPLFDVHAHLSDDIKPEELAFVYKTTGISAALLHGNSVETIPTLRLAVENSDGMFIPSVPIARDRTTHEMIFNEDTIGNIEKALRQGFGAIGQVSLRHRSHAFSFTPENGDSHPADGLVPREIYALAGEKKIPVTIRVEHTYRAELERAFQQNRATTFIWSHGGDGTPQVIDELLKTHPNLYVDLSSRNSIFHRAMRIDEQSITLKEGTLRQDWKHVLERYPSRFMVGLDVCCARYLQIKEVVQFYRNTLSQLPHETAVKIAYKNAESLFGIDIHKVGKNVSAAALSIAERKPPQALPPSTSPEHAQTQTQQLALPHGQSQTTPPPPTTPSPTPTYVGDSVKKPDVREETPSLSAQIFGKPATLEEVVTKVTEQPIKASVLESTTLAEFLVQEKKKEPARLAEEALIKVAKLTETTAKFVAPQIAEIIAAGSQSEIGKEKRAYLAKQFSKSENQSADREVQNYCIEPVTTSEHPNMFEEQVTHELNQLCAQFAQLIVQNMNTEALALSKHFSQSVPLRSLPEMKKQEDPEPLKKVLTKEAFGAKDALGNPTLVEDERGYLYYAVGSPDYTAAPRSEIIPDYGHGAYYMQSYPKNFGKTAGLAVSTDRGITWKVIEDVTETVELPPCPKYDPDSGKTCTQSVSAFLQIVPNDSGKGVVVYRHSKRYESDGTADVIDEYNLVRFQLEGEKIVSRNTVANQGGIGAIFMTGSVGQFVTFIKYPNKELFKLKSLPQNLGHKIGISSNGGRSISWTDHPANAYPSHFGGVIGNRVEKGVVTSSGKHLTVKHGSLSEIKPAPSVDSHWAFTKLKSGFGLSSDLALDEDEDLHVVSWQGGNAIYEFVPAEMFGESVQIARPTRIQIVSKDVCTWWCPGARSYFKENGIAFQEGQADILSGELRKTVEHKMSSVKGSASYLIVEGRKPEPEIISLQSFSPLEWAKSFRKGYRIGVVFDGKHVAASDKTDIRIAVKNRIPTIVFSDNSSIATYRYLPYAMGIKGMWWDKTFEKRKVRPTDIVVHPKPHRETQYTSTASMIVEYPPNLVGYRPLSMSNSNSLPGGMLTDVTRFTPEQLEELKVHENQEIVIHLTNVLSGLVEDPGFQKAAFQAAHQYALKNPAWADAIIKYLGGMKAFPAVAGPIANILEGSLELSAGVLLLYHMPHTDLKMTNAREALYSGASKIIDGSSKLFAWVVRNLGDPELNKPLKFVRLNKFLEFVVKPLGVFEGVTKLFDLVRVWEALETEKDPFEQLNLVTDASFNLIGGICDLLEVLGFAPAAIGSTGMDIALWVKNDMKGFQNNPFIAWLRSPLDDWFGRYYTGPTHSIDGEEHGQILKLLYVSWKNGRRFVNEKDQNVIDAKKGYELACSNPETDVVPYTAALRFANLQVPYKLLTPQGKARYLYYKAILSMVYPNGIPPCNPTYTIK